MSDVATTLAPESVVEPTVKILHRWTGEVLLEVPGASLDGASLDGASLDRASLDRASLVGARLDGASLVGALMHKSVLIETGETWGDYCREVLPALLTCTGKPLDRDSLREAWECHSWENCPMHEVFGAKGTGGVPALYRPRAEQFIRFFDGRHLPWSVVQEQIDALAGAPTAIA